MSCVYDMLDLPMLLLCNASSFLTIIWSQNFGVYSYFWFKYLFVKKLPCEMSALIFELFSLWRWLSPPRPRAGWKAGRQVLCTRHGVRKHLYCPQKPECPLICCHGHQRAGPQPPSSLSSVNPREPRHSAGQWDGAVWAGPGGCCNSTPQWLHLGACFWRALLDSQDLQLNLGPTLTVTLKPYCCLAVACGLRRLFTFFVLFLFHVMFCA